MRDCGNVSASSWESQSICAMMPRGAQQVCLLSLEEARHPEVAAQVIAQLEGHPHGHSLSRFASSSRPRRVPDRVAARSVLYDRTGSPGNLVPSDGRTREGTAQVSRRFWSWGSAADLSDMSSHSHRPRFVPCFAVATFASPFAVVRALLPVWPSIRFPWSPPSSLRKGRGLGKTRARGGKRSSKDLSRRRCASHNQRDGP